jgi:tRNA-2-methylthio-N6-dimethylallyladenosine synthase
MVEEHQRRPFPVIKTEGDPEYHHKLIPASRTDGLKAWVSIMYGCDNFCTYCVVPYLRGRERSRPPRDLVQEVRGLAEKGFKEVTLLGQNVNSYGKGLKEGCDFPRLLRMINDIPGIERVRFVTSHPRDLSDALIEAVRDLPKVCESIHLPVQSGSDRVLSAMNRRYTSSEYREKVKKLKGAVPDIALTTDVIVGFPGETEDDFEMTMRLLGDVEYDNIFAFKYSQRPNTAALKLTGHLPENVKEARLERVLSLQRHITLKKNDRYVGTVQEAESSPAGRGETKPSIFTATMPSSDRSCRSVSNPRAPILSQANHARSFYDIRVQDQPVRDGPHGPDARCLGECRSAL